MNIDSTFIEVAKTLIDDVFATPILYERVLPPAYDPARGTVVDNVTQINCNAGVLSRGRTEQGGVSESLELRLWIHHATSGMPHLPTTSDRVIYDNTTWQVTSCDPTYSSAGLIASKILCRNQ